ncbi:MAG: sugar ABC transporter permease [Anaerolineae bacterium]|nr:sugar ABC transporter permease [Anaerolineae bacterium]
MTATTIHRPTWWQRNQRRLAPYFFIAPFYILFVVFFLGPGLFAFYLSLHSWNGIGPLRFVGIHNFTELLSDAVFLKALRNTAFYSGTSLFVVTPISLLLAVALNARLVRFKDALRTIYFTPIVTSSVAISIVFLVLYNQRSGLLNTLLGYVGVGPINWLGSKQWSKFAVLGLVTWRWAGFNAIYFLAGLQTIPQALYEAAMVDGANRWQMFWEITIPMLRPVLLFVAVIVLIGSAQIFEEPYMLTSGGPVDSSLSIANYLYRVGLSQYLRFGYASAIGFVMFAIIFFFSWLQMRSFGIFQED